MRIFLGRDGLDGDSETAVYHWENGKLIKTANDLSLPVSLPWIERWLLMDARKHYLELGDDLSLDRAKEIGKLLVNLTAQLEA